MQNLNLFGIIKYLSESISYEFTELYNINYEIFESCGYLNQACNA